MVQKIIINPLTNKCICTHVCIVGSTHRRSYYPTTLHETYPSSFLFKRYSLTYSRSPPCEMCRLPSIHRKLLLTIRELIKTLIPCYGTRARDETVKTHYILPSLLNLNKKNCKTKPTPIIISINEKEKNYK